MSMAFLMFGSIEEMGYDRNSYYIYKKEIKIKIVDYHTDYRDNNPG